MADYKIITAPFANRGIVQKIDRSLLQEGQYVYLLNSISVQEGSISSRLGSTNLGAEISGAFPHTLAMLRLSPDAAGKVLYIGEGADIYRCTLADTSVTKIKTALPAWGRRWTGVTHRAGTTGKAFYYFAASEMLKDDGSMAAPQKWGILPPAMAPYCTVQSPRSKTIHSSPTTATWGTNEVNTFKSCTIRDTPGTPLDLSIFASSSQPSGYASNYYESGDYIKLVFVSQAKITDFEQFVLQIEVGDAGSSTYANYYEKIILPSPVSSVSTGTSSSTIQDLRDYQLYTEAGIGYENTGQSAGITQSPDRSDPYQVSPTGQSTTAGAPVFAPQVDDSNPSITVIIRKSEFTKVGLAGTSDDNSWKSVRGARLKAKATVEGSQLSITSLELIGGYGPDCVSAATLPYEYAYTYRNDNTGHESNPTPLMVDDNLVRTARRQPILVSRILKPADDQVTSVIVYRRGGAFADGYFRVAGIVNVGSATWAAGADGELYTTFTDEMADSDLVGNSTLEFDNDPPVFSSLPVGFSGSMSTTGITGKHSIDITVDTPAATTAESVLTPGTRIRVLDGNRSETVQVHALADNVAEAFFQYVHPSACRIQADTVANAPCTLSCAAFDSVFLAGDKNNPHLLYKSKTGRPESFPVDSSDGEVANQVIVGSQSNPIMAITEFGGGGIACMNLYGIFVVPVFRGAMQSAQETPASHGLVTSAGWCKADNEIYFLSHDGVYSWAGGIDTKRSEEIDWMFKGRTVNGIAPIDMTTSGLEYVHFSYFQNEIYIICRDINADTVRLRYHTMYRRWSIDYPSQESSSADGIAWVSALSTGDAYYTMKAVDAKSYLYQEAVGDTDGDSGFAVDIRTGFYQFGEPLLVKQIGDVSLELTSEQSIEISVFYDYSGTAAESFTIEGAAGRRIIPLPLNDGESFEVKAIAFRFYGVTDTNKPITLHSLSFSVMPLTYIQRGRATDWSDHGYPHDKRLDQLIIEYDTGGASIPVVLDIVSGVNGNTKTSGVAAFTLTGAGRSKATIPIRKAADSDFIVCKMSRLRPDSAQASDFKIFSHEVTYEKYPPDVTMFTDPSDYGNPYDKHFQQLVIDVDTGGVAASVAIYVDNATDPSQTLSINTTYKTRQQNLTLKTGITGKKARLAITPGVGGKFQLFSHNFITVGADKGPVIHTYDWEDLGYPHDKRLYYLVLEYEVTAALTMVLDGIKGVGASQSQFEIARFDLAPGGRRKPVFSLPSNTIVKMVRLHPDADDPDLNVNVKTWKYDFSNFEKLPPDIVPFTSPSDYGYPYDKHFQQLLLDVDTGGVAAQVFVDVDNVQKYVATVTTTENDRIRIITLPTGITGKLARIRATPGAGATAKFQLFSHDFIKVPADKGPVYHTYDWDDLGHPYDKRIYVLSLEYEVPTTVDMKLQVMSGVGSNQSASDAATFQLTPGGRKRLNVPIPGGVVAKLVRLTPTSGLPPEGAKIYRYEFEKQNYPADIVLFTEPKDYGGPFLKNFTQLVIDVDTGGVTANVGVEVDGTVKQTLQVSTTALDRDRTLTLNPGIVGRKARLIPAPGTNGKFQLFTHDFVTTPADNGPVKHTQNWDNLGSPHDKLLQTVTIDYEMNAGGTAVDMVFERIGGIGGRQQLSNISVQLTGTGRAVETFALPKETVAKLVRLRPDVLALNPNFKLWEYTFGKINYPPDIVLSTDWSSYGYDHEKYFQEVRLDIDTGGVACTVTVETDGSEAQVLSVTSGALAGDRQRILTLNPSLRGKNARLLLAPGVGGKAQLFSHNLKYLRADKGPVEHTFDWDDLGHPYDKRLKSVTIEYDTGGTSTDVVMDVITGIQGTTQTLAHSTFTLTGAGRSKQSFPIPDGTIVKMIRIRPLSNNTAFKMWGYQFDKENYPADIIYATEWSSDGHQCEKVYRSVVIDIDTGGVDCTVEVQIDGVTKQSSTINSGANDRSRVISLSSDIENQYIIGRRSRLKFTPGVGGKAQYFGHKFDFVKEPCAATHWDSFEQHFGSNGYKYMYKFWLEYRCAGWLTVRIYRDGGQLLIEETLPPQNHRNTEWFHLPAMNGAVLNKSKSYRVVIDAVDPLKPVYIYRDSSRVETMLLSAEARQPYNQHYLYEYMDLPV